MKPIQHTPGETDDYELSSGRRFSANCGWIAINDELETAEGYDGQILPDPDERATWVFPAEQLWTQAEREELADYMIALWTAWKTKPLPPIRVVDDA